MTFLWFALMAFIAYAASIDVGIFSHVALSCIILMIIMISKKFIQYQSYRLFIIGITSFLSLRYISWRINNTLPDTTWYEITLGIILLCAELYGIWIFFCGIFIGINPVKRKSPKLPKDINDYPTVDILIPTYNEPWSVVGTTLMAAAQINYPKEKLKIYCCDDGGTVQKRNDKDPKKAKLAEERHLFFKEKCENLGILYITREKNEHAKAGNLNHAMQHCSGDLVAIFDADHAPTTDFLERTVGPFLKDEKLFLVQTPHFFITPDPLEKNLDTYGTMPSENEMFYRHMHPGMDFWNASFFCGSAAVLRRRCLDEIGGISTKTITEDAETSLKLHALGYNSAYINHPMVAGLQPATFVSFVGQRARWAQGMIQIFLLDNPLFKRGLTFSQRLCYIANSSFWFFSLARIAFLFTPTLYLFFGVEIFKTDGYNFLAYAIPHLLGSIMLTNHLYGQYRWPFVSELYELALSIYSLPAVLKVFLAPRKPTFNVTAKDEKLDKSFLSPLASPFFVILGILTLSLIIGMWRYFAFPDAQEPILIVMGWTVFNMTLMLGVLGVLWEAKQMRETPRIIRNISVKLSAKSVDCSVKILDLSIGGARVILQEGLSTIKKGDIISIIIPIIGDKDVTVQSDVKNVRNYKGYQELGLSFINPKIEEEMAITKLIYGDSSVWEDMSAQRTKHHSLWKGLAFFFSLAYKKGLGALFHASRRDLS